MPGILNEAPPWKPDRCLSVILWHGCTDLDRQGIEASGGIDLSYSRPDLDFSRGFYTTTLRRQAEHWAKRRFDSKHMVRANNKPVVIRFKIARAELAQLTSLSFTLAEYEADDYWSLVQHCRKSRRAVGKKAEVVLDHGGPMLEDGREWFDVISGPVVADWRQRAAFAGMDQISFHTSNAIGLLNGALLSGDAERYLCLPIST